MEADGLHVKTLKFTIHNYEIYNYEIYEIYNFELSMVEYLWKSENKLSVSLHVYR